MTDSDYSQVRLQAAEAVHPRAALRRRRGAARLRPRRGGPRVRREAAQRREEVRRRPAHRRGHARPPRAQLRPQRRLRQGGQVSDSTHFSDHFLGHFCPIELLISFYKDHSDFLISKFLKISSIFDINDPKVILNFHGLFM